MSMTYTDGMFRLQLHRHVNLWIGMFLPTVVLLVFGRSLWQGFTPIDDIFLIAQNLAIRGPTLAHLKTIFTTYDPELYIPLTLFSFQLNYLMSGLNPWSYHLVNLLLHAANAYVIYLLIRRIGGHTVIALFGGLLFAVHPIQTESVVWLTIRKDLLSSFLALLSLLFYIIHEERPRTLLYISSLLLFLLALFAKVTVVPLPAILLLVSVVKKRKISWKMILTITPFLLLSITFLGIAFMGKQHVMSALKPLSILVLSGKSVVLTLEHVLLPKALSPFYEEPAGAALFSAGNMWACGAAILLGALSIFALLRSPRIGMGLIFFLFMLAPSFLSPFRAGAVYGTADHYAYLPIAGLVFALCMGSIAIHERTHFSFGNAPRIVAGLILVFLCLLSIRQTKIWDSSNTLFAAALKVVPSSVAVRTAYARILLKEENPEEAFAVLKEGLKFGKDARLSLAAGMVYAKTGQIPEAETQFRNALALDPQNPEPIFSLGSLAEQTGRQDEALVQYNRALTMDPSYVAAQLGIGRIQQERKNYAAAEDQFRTALAWNWNLADAHRGLAKALVKQGKADEAEMHRLLAEEIERVMR